MPRARSWSLIDFIRSEEDFVAYQQSLRELGQHDHRHLNITYAEFQRTTHSIDTLLRAQIQALQQPKH